MYPKLSILLISTSLLLGCKESKLHRIVNKEQAGLIVIQSEVPANIDADFNAFIKHFSKDSLFQISRIDFPLRFQEYDLMNDSDVVKTISKQEFRQLDFTYRKPKSDADNWAQNIDVRDNQATIEIRGIDNGIMIHFYFEKRDGKWHLVEWVDSST